MNKAEASQKIDELKNSEGAGATPVGTDTSSRDEATSVST
jgi:hypothetical protein